MLRRLYFVLPNIDSTTRVLAELQQAGIESRHLAVASRTPVNIPIQGVQIRDAVHDRGDKIEHTLWNLNLAVFGVAALALISQLLIQGLTAWLLVPLMVMAATFIAGLRFTHIPNTHLHEFAEALHHGELVLMADVEPTRVAIIEDLVHRHHPDAAVGGIGWSSDLLHV